MVFIKNKTYSEQSEFVDSLEKLGNSSSWFSYLCAKDEGITEIGLFEKIYFVIGSWLKLVENQTSEEKIDAVLSEILKKNSGLVKPEQYSSIFKIAVRANIIKNYSENSIQLVANEIHGIADIIQSIQEEAAKEKLVQINQITRVIVPNTSHTSGQAKPAEEDQYIGADSENENLITSTVKPDTLDEGVNDEVIATAIAKELGTSERASQPTEILTEQVIKTENDKEKPSATDSFLSISDREPSIDSSKEIENKHIEDSQKQKSYKALPSPSASNEPNEPKSSSWSHMAGVAIKLALVVGVGLLAGRFFSGSNMPTDLSGKADFPPDPHGEIANKTQPSLYTSPAYHNPALDTMPQFPAYRKFSVLSPPSSLTKRFSKFTEKVNEKFVKDPGAAAVDFFLDQKLADANTTEPGYADADPNNLKKFLEAVITDSQSIQPHTQVEEAISQIDKSKVNISEPQATPAKTIDSTTLHLNKEPNKEANILLEAFGDPGIKEKTLIFLLESASTELFDDQNFILKAQQIILSRSSGFWNVDLLSLVSPKLKADRSFMDQYSKLERLPNEQETTEERLFIKRLHRVQSEYELEYMFRTLPSDITSNKKLLLKGLLPDAGERFPELTTLLKYVNDDLKNDRHFVIRLIQKYPSGLAYASEELRNDPDFIYGYTDQFVLRPVQWASEELKNDREFMTKLGIKSLSSLRFASDTLKNDREYILEACKQIPDFYSYAKAYEFQIMSYELQTDREFMQRLKEIEENSE